MKAAVYGLLGLFLVLNLNACLLERIPDAGHAVPDRTVDTGLAERLRGHVEVLAVEIGQRSYLAPEGLDRAADYIEGRFRSYEAAPTSTVLLQSYRMPELPDERLHRCTPVECPTGQPVPPVSEIEFRNLALEIRGTKRPDEVLVIGAHYDSDGCESGGCNPGADDNASGTAALLELAREFHANPRERTVRLVAFTNEEEPFFHTQAMGSLVFASRDDRPDEMVVGMLSLETIGYYSDEPGSQDVPWIMSAFFDMPTVGNFITFVGDWDSEDFVRASLSAFRRTVSFPSEGLVTYGWVEGVDWSDHWSYWQQGVPAVMITDTAPNRNRCYHKPCDTADTLDYDRMAHVVTGLMGVVEVLGQAGTK